MPFYIKKAIVDLIQNRRLKQTSGFLWKGISEIEIAQNTNFLFFIIYFKYTYIVFAHEIPVRPCQGSYVSHWNRIYFARKKQ